MAGEKINYDYITEYLHQVLPETKGYLKDMEDYAHINEVPIIHENDEFSDEFIIKIANMENEEFIPVDNFDDLFD